MQDKLAFRKALIDTIVRMGSPINPKGNWFGWAWWEKTEEFREHLRAGGIDYGACSDPRDEYYPDFKGTFYEGDHSSMGLDITIVAADGTRYEWRYAGSMSEMIYQMLKEG